MTTTIDSTSATQSSLLVNGVQSMLFDQTGHLRGVDTGHRDMGATVAANAMTLTLQPTTIRFRNSTLTSGIYNQRSVASVLSLVLPTGATLGTINGIAARFVVLVLDVSPAVQELAVANISGGGNFNEAGVITTVAISAASTSALVVYSTTARTGVAYRVGGFTDHVQTTAGTYAAAPTLVQGGGALAVSSMGGIGYGQTWQSVTASRAFGTTYHNTTGKPIQISVTGVGTVSASSTQMSCVVNGVAAAFSGTILGTGGIVYGSYISVIVPPNASYLCSNDGQCALASWSELR